MKEDEELLEEVDTKKERPDKKERSQQTMNGGVLMEIRRVRRMSWGTVSKAFCRSKKTAGRKSLLARAELTLVRRWKRRSRVL
jgi:hypothetical protein